MSNTLKLEPILDIKAAAPLQTALQKLRGTALVVDASGVQRLGALCLQVLISAQRTWVDDAASFCLTPCSPAFAEALRLFGASERFEEAGLQEMDTK